MEAYERLEKIGEGQFGRVFRGRRRFTGQFCALKFLPKAQQSPAALAALRGEVAILQRLAHPNVVRLLDFFETHEDVVLVTELCVGELFEVLTSDGALAPAAMAAVARELTRALAYLHGAGVMHRDLKPQNVLIGAGGAVKLADFGFAKETSHELISSIKGTPLYMAPEMFTEERYGPSAEVWGLGVLLFELATGRPPFFAATLPELMKAITDEAPLEFPPALPAPLVDFLSQCLRREPAARPPFAALLAHPYIAADLN
jgi:fused-like protein